MFNFRKIFKKMFNFKKHGANIFGLEFTFSILLMLSGYFILSGKILLGILFFFFGSITYGFLIDYIAFVSKEYNIFTVSIYHFLEGFKWKTINEAKKE